MRVLIFKSALLLNALLFLPVLMMRPAIYDPQAISNLLLPPPDCAAPCFMGLQPGFSTIAEAQQRLTNHEWVDKVMLGTFRPEIITSGPYGWITFTWSDQHPPLIDPSYPGRVDFRRRGVNSVVDTIRFRTQAAMPQFEAWLGPGQSASAFTHDQADNLSYEIIYRSTTVSTIVGLSTSMRCPANLLAYWYSPADVTLTTWVGVGLTQVELDEVLRAC